MSLDDWKEILIKLKMRDAILRYFVEPRSSYGLTSQPEFSQWDAQTVKQVLYAADRLGLVAKISGSGADSQYQTTDDGRIVVLCVFFLPSAIRVFHIASTIFKVRIRSPPRSSERIIAETGCQRYRPLFLLNIQQKIGTQP